MAVSCFKDAFVSIDGNDVSDHVRQVTLNYNAEALDKTAMTFETRARVGGLKDWSLDVELFSDWGTIDSIVFSRVGASTIAVIVRPTTAAASTSNPQYSGTALLESFPPVSGSVGELSMAPLRFTAASDLSRATA